MIRKDEELTLLHDQMMILATVTHHATPAVLPSPATKNYRTKDAKKMYVATDKLYSPEVKQTKAVFFLREGELHEMGLLFYRYLMKKRGVEAIYLGQSVPFEDLKQVVKSHNPQYLVTALVATLDEDALEAYLNNLSTSFPKLKVIVSGYQISQYSRPVPSNIIKVNDVQAYVKYLDTKL